MKITALAIPALCQLPLIEAPRPTVKSCTIKTEWLPAGFLNRIIARVANALFSPVPVGYEDEAGFHYGVAEAPFPAVRTGRGRSRRAGKTCLNARWETMPATNLISGGHLVLQWDSSSRPPSQLSPESFSAKSHPRNRFGTANFAPRF